MKSEICLNSFQEIPGKEQQDLNGGGLGFLAAIAAIALAQIVLDWDNFKNGLTGLPEEESRIVIKLSH